MFFFCCCAIVWLLVASAAGLTASIKLHEPDWLVQQAWLTFGRIRTIHLNAVAYGWAPMAGLGIALYFVSLTTGGWLQGQAMLDAARPFMESVAVTLPYLKGRSLGGALMAAGHLVFAAHFVAMALGLGPQRDQPALFRHMFRREATQ